MDFVVVDRPDYEARRLGPKHAALALNSPSLPSTLPAPLRATSSQPRHRRDGELGRPGLRWDTCAATVQSFYDDPGVDRQPRAVSRQPPARGRRG
jgi:hypothetical protein